MIESTRITKENGVLEIEIARPEKKNALTGEMYRSMTNALGDASQRREIGAVLVRGTGSAFCAGNDLADFMSRPNESIA